MGLLNKIIAVGLAIAIALLIFQVFIFIPLGILLFLWLIRIGADIYWAGKDNDRW